MKFEFTAEELERLTAFEDGRGTCFDNWDEQLLQKLRGYISQAEAFEEAKKRAEEKKKKENVSRGQEGPI